MDDARRAGPPAPLRDVIVRGRLVEALLDRWERRLVLVTAGAGFGKTTLLAQAIAENALAPRGIDCWVPCPSEEDSSARLARLVLRGLGEPPDSASPETDVLRALWERAPTPVAIVVDDVHHVAPHSDAEDLLRRLVGDAPDHVHLVLAGREQPDIPLARLDALGSITRITEDDLLFDQDELGRFATLRGRASVPDATGGWPALAELSVAAEQTTTAEFLWEEVLGSLTPPQRELLGVVSAVGGADDELASALLDRPVRVAEELAHVPMVVAGTDGWCVVHVLWERALGQDVCLGPDQLRIAAGRLVADDRLGAAFELLAEAELWDDAEELLTDVCRPVNPAVGPAQLRRWVSRLPPDRAAGAAADLALGLAALDDDVDAALDLLDRARKSYEHDHDVDSELDVLVHLANTVYFRNDLERVGDLLARIDALAATKHPRAVAYARFSASLVAELAGDHEAMSANLATLDDDLFSGSFGALVDRYRSLDQLLFGSLSEAERLAQRAIHAADPAFRPTASAVLFWARWMAGHDDAASLATDLRPPATGSTLRHDVGSETNLLLVRAMAGDAQPVLDRITELRSELDHAEVLVSRVVGALAHAAALVGVGREDDAATALTAEITQRPLDGRATAPHLRSVALSQVLVPDSRVHWDELPLGEGPRLGRACAQLLVDLRGGGVAPEALRRWSTSVDRPGDALSGLAPRHLPVMWCVEVALRLCRHDATAPVGEALARGLGDSARPCLRLTARSADRSLAKVARSHLAASAQPPSAKLQLRLTGPTSLLRDGLPVDGPEWRRERVRALLAELVLRGRATREDLAAALWPDLGPDAGANNLRVTLSYLLRVLEPDRADPEPSWYIQSDRTSLAFDPHDTLAVDVGSFEEALTRAEAAVEAGTMSEAAEAYLEAAEAYHGDLLADLTVDPGNELRRERLRSEFVRAAIRGGELLVADGRVTAALLLSERALDVDEWAEDAYAVAASAHLARGDHGAARRALETAIARCDELDVAVSERTAMLARRLNLVL